MTTPLLVGLAIASVLLFGSLAWTGRRLMQEPEWSPRRFLRGAGADRPVLACFGDSLTHGRVGADWVSGLRSNLAGEAVVLNAGINGRLAWNLRQALPELLRCEPHGVVLLVGSNDVMAAERPDRARGYQRDLRLPRCPDLDWSREEMRGLVAELAARVPRLALCTIPPLGDLEGPATPLVRRWNEGIASLSREHGAALLDLHGVLSSELRADGPAYEGAMARLGLRMLSGCWLHYSLGRSWDAVARRRGSAVFIDGVHFSDRAAARVGALVRGWWEASAPPTA